MFLFHNSALAKDRILRNYIAMIKNFYTILILFITVSSCTGHHKDTAPIKHEQEPPNQESMFKTVEGWPDSIKMRRVGESFSESVENVQFDSSGAIWVLRESKTNPDKRETKRYLEKYDGQGNYIFGLSEAVGTILSSFTVHPSGELTIVELRKKEGGEEHLWHNIWLKRIRTDGSIIIESPLREFNDGDKVVIYHDPDDIYRSLNLLIASREDVYLFVEQHKSGSKLYKFDNKLQQSWNRQILPVLPRSFLSYSDVKLGIDELFNICIVIGLYKEDVAAWERHFAKILPKESENSYLFFMQFDPNGNLKISRAFGTNEHLQPSGIAVKNGILTVGTSSRIQRKFNEPNHTQEWHPVFLKAEIASGKVIDYKILESQRDTLVNDFHVNAEGHGFFVGTNDFIQVDSNSVVEFGQGYVLKVDEHGNKLSYLSFRGPRHISVNSISLLENGKLLFGGTFNGSITHTADADSKQDFQWAMLGVIDIN